MKDKLTLSVDRDLIERAKSQGVNFSALLNETLETYLRALPCDKCGGTGRIIPKRRVK